MIAESSNFFLKGKCLYCNIHGILKGQKKGGKKAKSILQLKHQEVHFMHIKNSRHVNEQENLTLIAQRRTLQTLPV